MVNTAHHIDGQESQEPDEPPLSQRTGPIHGAEPNRDSPDPPTVSTTVMVISLPLPNVMGVHMSEVL